MKIEFKTQEELITKVKEEIERRDNIIIGLQETIDNKTTVIDIQKEQIIELSRELHKAKERSWLRRILE